MKAKASGTPAKLEATPQKVIRLERMNLRQPPADGCIGQQEAEDPATNGGEQADLDANPIGSQNIGIIEKRQNIFYSEGVG